MPIIAPETWFFLGGVLPDFGWARTFFERLAELAAFFVAGAVGRC